MIFHAKVGKGGISSFTAINPYKLTAVLLIILNRGPYMSAHILLNLLTEYGKRDKMRGLPIFLSLFRNEFNKVNNTRARMVDSIYHMSLILL